MALLSRIRVRMQHGNRLSAAVIGGVRRLGLLYLKHFFMYEKMRKEYLHKDTEFTKFAKTHKRELRKVYDLLEDDYSRQTLEALEKFHSTFDIRSLKGTAVYPQYFLNDILEPEDYEVYIDGGAYTGDTACEFIKKWKKDNNYKMYLWEADKDNIKQIYKTLKQVSNYSVIPFAMWSEKTTLNFDNKGSGVSMVTDAGNTRVSADSIDNVMQGKKVTFIKMDIEGSETEGLKGAEQTIKQWKPKLAICVYHKYEHWFQIPFMIKEMVPEYKLYLRHHSDNTAETVLYAVCK